MGPAPVSMFCLLYCSAALFGGMHYHRWAASRSAPEYAAPMGSGVAGPVLVLDASIAGARRSFFKVLFNQTESPTSCRHRDPAQTHRGAALEFATRTVGVSASRVASFLLFMATPSAPMSAPATTLRPQLRDCGAKAAWERANTGGIRSIETRHAAKRSKQCTRTTSAPD